MRMNARRRRRRAREAGDVDARGRARSDDGVVVGAQQEEEVVQAEGGNGEDIPAEQVAKHPLLDKLLQKATRFRHTLLALLPLVCVMYKCFHVGTL